ncbi:hypothetical protein ACINB_09650 [Acidovorax sp. NB1]|nr:hypothetical protein ACINB_09650 [Acidovorax sp. NB1]
MPCVPWLQARGWASVRMGKGLKTQGLVFQNTVWLSMQHLPSPQANECDRHTPPAPSKLRAGAPFISDGGGDA